MRVYDEAVPCLRDLESLELMFTGDHNHSLAHRIGASVTSLFARTPVPSEDIAQLNKCPRLERLLVVEDGDELVLAETAKSLPNLRFLYLRWNRFAQAGDAEHDLSKAADGAMLQIVQSLPKLEILVLLNIRIAVEELRAILAHMGTRLKSFTMSTRGWEDTELDTVQDVLVAMITHNPELRDVSFSQTLSSEGVDNIDERVIRKGKQIRRLFCRLQRRAMCLEPDCLQRYVATLTGSDELEESESE